jgi:hypothetical protein
MPVYTILTDISMEVNRGITKKVIKKVLCLKRELLE